MIEQGITQQKLANKINVTQKAVSKWVNLQSEPTETAIINCAKFFNVSTDYLLGLEDESGRKTYSNNYGKINNISNNNFNNFGDINF